MIAGAAAAVVRIDVIGNLGAQRIPRADLGRRGVTELGLVLEVGEPEHPAAIGGPIRFFLLAGAGARDAQHDARGEHGLFGTGGLEAAQDLQAGDHRLRRLG